MNAPSKLQLFMKDQQRKLHKVFYIVNELAYQVAIVTEGFDVEHDGGDDESDEPDLETIQ